MAELWLSDGLSLCSDNELSLSLCSDDEDTPEDTPEDIPKDPPKDPPKVSFGEDHTDTKKE
jgi:hypothetical protein